MWQEVISVHHALFDRLYTNLLAYIDSYVRMNVCIYVHTFLIVFARTSYVCKNTCIHVCFINKKIFYKKMSLQNLKTLRKSPISNA